MMFGGVEAKTDWSFRQDEERSLKVSMLSRYCGICCKSSMGRSVSDDILKPQTIS